MGAINDGLGIRKDLIPKDVCHFCWNELTFNIVVEIVATANRMDPENADRELREALLRRLRDSNLVTLTGDSSGDLSDAAQTATQGGDKIVDQDVPPRLMSSLPTS
ncbi:MAG: hypothetical protein EXS47_01705 [Candidatus Zambryskibacteria bacterium]|nr:hypothetical protein [Candidatus Zambryskibacteria bacterium]